MYVDQTNAARWIGHINPGVGYQWLVNSNGMQLWVPDRATRELDLFWPVLLGLLGLALVIGVLRGRTKKGVAPHG